MRKHSSGFTLIEVVIALSLIAVCVIATAPLFVYASQQNAGGRDRGTASALAVQRMEQLRALDYDLLANGGNLDANVTGFSDTSNPDCVVRWLIADNPNPPAPTKIITVRAVATDRVIGKPKAVTLVTVRGG